jgi:hypothetical protein
MKAQPHADELLTQLSVVVDLAVENDGIAACIAVHGLQTSRGDIDDGQARVAKKDPAARRWVAFHLTCVRAAVLQGMHAALQPKLHVPISFGQERTKYSAHVRRTPSSIAAVSRARSDASS